MTDEDQTLVSENGVVGNRLLLNDDDLLSNLQDVQTDPALHNGTPTPVSPELTSRDFSVEMETGTGKLAQALRLVKRMTLHCPDDQIFTDLKRTYSPLTPSDVMGHVIHTLQTAAQRRLMGDLLAAEGPDG